MIQNDVITQYKLRCKSNYSYFIQSINNAYYYAGIYGSDRLFSAGDLFSERREFFLPEIYGDDDRVVRPSKKLELHHATIIRGQFNMIFMRMIIKPIIIFLNGRTAISR